MPAFRTLLHLSCFDAKLDEDELRKGAYRLLRTVVAGLDQRLALGRFLQSADQEVWRFKAREADRRHVEDSIREGRHDIDCGTECKSSPHVLVCTKNQASYERRVAQRRADLEDLTRLKA